MTRPTVAPSGAFPEHSCWNVEPHSLSSGDPSVPGAEHRAPVRALPGASPGISSTRQRPLRTREDTRQGGNSPHIPPPWLSGTLNFEVPKGCPAPPQDPAQKGEGFGQLCSVFSSDTAPHLKPGPAKSFTRQCLSHQGPGARGQLELSPQRCQNSGYLHHPWPQWRRWDDTARPGGGLLASVRCPDPKNPKRNEQTQRGTDRLQSTVGGAGRAMLMVSAIMLF